MTHYIGTVAQKSIIIIEAATEQHRLLLQSHIPNFFPSFPFLFCIMPCFKSKNSVAIKSTDSAPDRIRQRRSRPTNLRRILAPASACQRSWWLRAALPPGQFCYKALCHSLLAQRTPGFACLPEKLHRRKDGTRERGREPENHQTNDKHRSNS